MAGMFQREKNAVYNVNWWWDGSQYSRSTRTKDESKASLVKRRVEDTIFKLENGLLSIPEGVDVSEFILNGGKLREPIKPLPAKPTTLKELFGTYSANLAIGAKEENTLYTEKIHQKHILRLMGEDRAVNAIEPASVQEYVTNRIAEGRKPDTIKKKLNTLRMAWRWGITGRGLTVNRIEWRIKDLSFPRENAKPPFQTFDQIRMKIARGGLTSEGEKELWDSLFLRSEEITELLQHVVSVDPITHALFAFAALTGARRSELMRSQVEDLDFRSRSITIREKKRIRGDSYRTVDMLL